MSNVDVGNFQGSGGEFNVCASKKCPGSEAFANDIRVSMGAQGQNFALPQKPGFSR